MLSDPSLPAVPGGVVRELMTYPVKGCAGHCMPDAMMTRAGLAHDRSFMVVDPKGRFRSQRSDPRLAVIRPAVSPDGARLTLSAPGVGPLQLAVDLDSPRCNVRLFGTLYQGIDQGDAVAAWMSRVLGTPSRLVRVPPEHERVTPGQTPGTSGYADACPVHLLSQSSLDLLNERLVARGGRRVPTGRFRPNIVVAGWPEPHTEDQVRQVTIGDAGLGYAKPAIRCVVTTVDQESGRRAGPEPLRTLATYRRGPDGIRFGANFAVVRPGRLSVGDKVIVHRWAEPDPDP